MIEHVLRRALLCDSLESVYVATCDEEIRDAVNAFGGQVVMTSAAHERATDRVAEAAELVFRDVRNDVVVMIQGDEPMVTPEMITAAIEPILKDPSVLCVNLASRISNQQEYTDPNTIKVVTDVNGDALYFSRSPIPARVVDRDLVDRNFPVLKQICVIPFRHDFLLEFSRLSPTPLERAESIDMLRVLEHGGRVRIVEAQVKTHAVDTPEDLRFVENLMESDPFVLEYQRAMIHPE